MTKQQIIDKIQKLLALANSSNENEAKSAASMAQALLTKYNLTMKEVDKSSQSYTSKAFETNKRRQDTSARYIQTILKTFFFVEIINTKKPVKVYEDVCGIKFEKTVYENMYLIFGEPHNVEIAQYIYDFLDNSFKVLYRDFAKKNKTGKGSRVSYYYGVYAGLYDQLKQTKTKVEQEVGLVVVEDKDLTDFISQSIGKTKSLVKKTQTEDKNALNQGYKEGQSLKIAKGLGGGDQDQQLGETLKLTGG
jgi:hypothetical protein